VVEAIEGGTHSLPKKEPQLRDYLHVSYARRWAVAGTFVLFLVGATILLCYQPAMYRSRCQLQLQPTRTRITSFSEVYDPTMGADVGGPILRRQFLETQYRLILSEPLLRDTFDALGFGNKPEFADLPNPIPAFARYFSVSGIRNTVLADVTFEWTDPDTAQRTLDYLIKQYVHSSRQRALGVTEEGLKSLRDKAEKLRLEVTAKSRKLREYMLEHNMFSLELEQAQLKNVNAQLGQAQIERVEAETRYQNIRDALATRHGPVAMPEAIDSPTVRDLKLEYIHTKLRCSDLAGSLGPNHPEVKAAQSTLNMIAENLEMEVNSVLAGAKADYQRAKLREEALTRILNNQKKAVMEFGKYSEYGLLQDEQKRVNDTYRDVIGRIEEIDISLAVGSDKDTVFINEPPDRPEKPAKPRKKLTLAVGGLLGLVAGIAMAFFLEYLDTSIKTKEDAEQAVGAAVLGYVPALQNGQAGAEAAATRPLELHALEEPRSAVAEAFRSIRTALSFTHAEPGCHQFAVTSALPAEGKTLASVNIALALAQTGKRVLLVDADLRRPRIQKVLDLDGAAGLSNLLAAHEDVSLDDVIRPHEVEGLSVITSGPIPPNPAELLGSSRMEDLIKVFAERFDYVVYDMPPTINVTDAVVLSRRLHGAILVVRSFVTDRAAANRARELFAGGGARVLGVVLNCADAPRTGYHTDDYYYYYYDKYYYAEQGKGGRKTGPSR